jgi:flagellar protein FlbD
VIALHRITHGDQPVYLNPDMILFTEATPDTVITLTNGSRIVVHEPPETVAQLVRSWRASILTEAVTAPELAEHPRVADAISNVLQFPQERSHEAHPNTH